MTPDPSEITRLRTIATLSFRVIAVCVTAYSMRPAQSAIYWLLTSSEFPFRPRAVFLILDLITAVVFISMGVILWLVSPSLARRAVPHPAADEQGDRPTPEPTQPTAGDQPHEPRTVDHDTLRLRRIFLLAVRTFAVIAAATKVYGLSMVVLNWILQQSYFIEAHVFSEVLSLAVLAGIWHFAPTLAGLAVPDPPGKFSPQRVSLAIATGILGLILIAVGLWGVASDNPAWPRLIPIIVGAAMIASTYSIARFPGPVP